MSEAREAGDTSEAWETDDTSEASETDDTPNDASDDADWTNTSDSRTASLNTRSAMRRPSTLPNTAAASSGYWEWLDSKYL